MRKFKVGDKVFLPKYRIGIYGSLLRESEDWAKFSNVPLNKELIVSEAYHGSIVLKDRSFAHPAEKFLPISELWKYDNEAKLQKARDEYPIGTKFIDLDGIVKVAEIDPWTVCERTGNVAVRSFGRGGMVFYDNVWSKIVEKPKERPLCVIGGEILSSMSDVKLTYIRPLTELLNPVKNFSFSLKLGKYVVVTVNKFIYAGDGFGCTFDAFIKWSNLLLKTVEDKNIKYFTYTLGNYVAKYSNKNNVKIRLGDVKNVTIEQIKSLNEHLSKL